MSCSPRISEAAKRKGAYLPLQMRCHSAAPFIWATRRSFSATEAAATVLMDPVFLCVTESEWPTCACFYLGSRLHIRFPCQSFVLEVFSPNEHTVVKNLVWPAALFPLASIGRLANNHPNWQRPKYPALCTAHLSCSPCAETSRQAGGSPPSRPRSFSSRGALLLISVVLCLTQAHKWKTVMDQPLHRGCAEKNTASPR